MTLTIYRLYLKDESLNYVGSTIKNPYERYLEHQTCYNSANFSCGSWRLFDSGQEVLMEPLEKCSETDRTEYEGYWIRQYKKNSVNKYLINDIDYINYQKKYQAVNADRLCERIKCTCGLFISRKISPLIKKQFLIKKEYLQKQFHYWNPKLLRPFCARDPGRLPKTR